MRKLSQKIKNLLFVLKLKDDHGFDRYAQIKWPKEENTLKKSSHK